MVSGLSGVPAKSLSLYGKQKTPHRFAQRPDILDAIEAEVGKLVYLLAH